MKFFFSALVTETNTFSNIPTSRDSFETHVGRAALENDSLLTGYVQHFDRQCAAAGASGVIGLCAYAQPSSPVVQRDYEHLRDALVDELRRCGPLDAVFLMLHGAMAAEECLDCEGDVLARIRAVVGPRVPVLAVLDPHAHLTAAMLANADVLAFMKEYPHTDGPACLDQLFGIGRAMLEGSARPRAAVADCRVIGLWPTQDSPMREFCDRLRTLEREPGILSISFVHGFPWGDTPDTGSRVLVYGDGDSAAAQALADRLAAEVWRMRDYSQPQLTSISAALDLIERAPAGPIVLADGADNPGGGAPSDSSFILRAVLDRGLQNIAFALFYDPAVVGYCHQVGVGAHVSVRIGGKLSRFSGEPVDIEGTVMGIARDALQIAFGNTPDRMGDTAWIRARGVDLIVSSTRTQCFHPLAFSHLGLDPTQSRALVLKSLNHFQAGFGEMAKQTLMVATPGALNMEFARLPYRVMQRSYWPRDEQPLR
jgi:microcystin degradation protein MlrC